MAKRFYLYQRERKDKPPMWYVRFRADDGSIGSPVSTGKSDEQAAESWAVERLLVGDAVPKRKPKAKTFEEWAAPWWKLGKCPYLQEKIANGYSMSPAYAEVRRSYLDKHLIPEFGKIPLSQLTPTMFRDYKMRLVSKGKLSPATINRILGTARVMFNYAVEMREMENNPMAPVKELKETPEERGILTPEEFRLLFVDPGAYKRVWHEEPRHYVLNLLAATTGMRLGECQALQVQHVHADCVEVRHSWHDKYGLGPAKQGSGRLVTIPGPTSSALSLLIGLNRWGEPLPEDYVFWGQGRDVPLTKTAILKQYKVALDRIGITEAQRAQRVLLFHSHRHYFNTFVRGKVPDEQLRRVTGHKSVTMSDNYDHAAVEHLADVKAVQEKMFAAERSAQ